MTEPILRRDVLNYLFQPTPRAPMLTGAAGEIRMPERMREPEPPRFGSRGLLNIDPAAAYTGLLAPGGDPQSNAPRARLGVIQGLMNAPEALLDATAGTTRRFMQGEIDPNSLEAVRQGANAAMAVGGPGLLATRPGLGVFGRNPKAQDMSSFSWAGAGSGQLTRKIILPKGGELWTEYNLVRRPDNTLSMDAEFYVHGRDMTTGRPYDDIGKMTNQEQLEAINYAVSDMMRRTDNIRPGHVSFSAGRKKLIPLYERALRRYAKENPGVEWSRRAEYFDVDLPNPRVYNAEVVKGLLGTK